MRSTQTFSVLFWIYTKRAKNNKANIYVRITMNGKKVNIRLKYKVNIDYWDSRSQSVKGKNLSAKEINLYLDEVRSGIMQCYRDLKMENKLLTAYLLKSRYLGEDRIHHSLVDIFEYHNEKMVDKIKDNTMGHYKTTQRYILTYLKEKYGVANVFLQNLDYEFLIGFEAFLRSYKSRPSQGKISNNVVMKHIQRFRNLITLAYNIEWIDNDPFARFKPKIENKEREFLTGQELKRIENFNCSIERLMIVKDLFVFSCYTGIAYADIMKINRDNIMIGID